MTLANLLEGGVQGHDELVLLIGDHIRAADLRQDVVALSEAGNVLIVICPVGVFGDEVCDLVDEVGDVGGGGLSHVGIVTGSGTGVKVTVWKYFTSFANQMKRSIFSCGISTDMSSV